LPVACQLTQLPHLSRRDPRLGQPSHPQQVSQIRSVTLVVFDPAVAERLDPERMRQVNLRPGTVRRPALDLGGPKADPPPSCSMSGRSTRIETVTNVFPSQQWRLSYEWTAE
jgi:hypothetical protein